jgi:CRP-like cAMP-binding protein
MEKWQSALKQAEDWLAELNFGSARQRVLHFIHKMHEVSQDGTATLFSRDDMGAMMDLKFETVSREVTALVRAGVIAPIDKHGRHYKVVHPECLQEK